MANLYNKNKRDMLGRADSSAFPTPMAKAMAMQPTAQPKPIQEEMYGGGTVNRRKKRKYTGGGKVRKMYAKGGGIRKANF
jgi:hypothetical protein